jgi:hypothetical protein
MRREISEFLEIVIHQGMENLVNFRRTVVDRAVLSGETDRV